MNGRFFCATCSHLLYEETSGSVHFIAKDHVPCPKCGGSNIRADVLVEEKMVMFDQMSLKAKDAQGPMMTMKVGGSLSADGTVAQIEQVVDKRAKTYKKKVTLADGTVVKDVEGPLGDQSLHGPHKKDV